MPTVVMAAVAAPPDAARVYLRAVQDDDLPVLAAMRRDLDLQSLLLSVPEAIDDPAVCAWIDRRRGEPGGSFLVVAAPANGPAIGYVQLSGVHRRSRFGYGGVALVRSARGRGYGQAALRLLAAHAARDLGLAKLLAEIRADNIASLAAHAAVGFRTVGTLEAHFRDVDTVHDVVLLERRLEDLAP